MGERTARSFMSLAAAFGKSPTVGDLPRTVLYALVAPSTPVEIPCAGPDGFSASGHRSLAEQAGNRPEGKRGQPDQSMDDQNGDDRQDGVAHELDAP